MSESGRRRLADEFNSRVKALCAPHCWDRVQPARTAHAKDHERLANEIYRLAELDQLFTFVVYTVTQGTLHFSRNGNRTTAVAQKDF